MHPCKQSNCSQTMCPLPLHEVRRSQAHTHNQKQTLKAAEKQAMGDGAMQFRHTDAGCTSCRAQCIAHTATWV